jgi:DNA-binding response OmpR family regulator
MAEKILIIDDDIDTLKLVGLMLQKQGYRILAANNGPQGLAYAEDELPDLILLDVMMPDMDGYEVARRLRANPRTASIPILMFTAKSQLDEKVTGFEAGADDYLTKPTHPAELSAHVKALLARVRKGGDETSSLPDEKRPFTVGVTAVRGGLGVTTTALNVSDAIRRYTSAEVIVAELRPGGGTLGPDLGDPQPQALRSLLQGNIASVSRQNLRRQLLEHKTGLLVLPGSIQPKDGLLTNALPSFETLVKQLGYLSKYLILDIGCGLTPLTKLLLPLCDLLVVVVEPVKNSVAHSRLFLDDLQELGVPAASILPVVVSRVRSDTNLSREQVEKELGRGVVVAVTPAPELLYTASRMLTTAIDVDPKSLTAQQFAKLAATILELEQKKAAQKK